MSMADGQIRFEDGAAYERMMGVWAGSLERSSWTGSRHAPAGVGLTLAAGAVLSLS
jgi:hypothetical protein